MAMLSSRALALTLTSITRRYSEVIRQAGKEEVTMRLDLSKNSARSLQRGRWFLALNAGTNVEGLQQEKKEAQEDNNNFAPTNFFKDEANEEGDTMVDYYKRKEPNPKVLLLQRIRQEIKSTAKTSHAPRFQLSMTSDFEWASPKRLKLLLAQIRGLSLDTAIIQMSFSAKHQAQRVREVLESLRLKAVNTYQKDPVNLFVDYAAVTKGQSRKRIDIKGRGRMGIITSTESKFALRIIEKDFYKEFRRIGQRHKILFKPENPRLSTLLPCA